jgi:hypothetical protein
LYHHNNQHQHHTDLVTINAPSAPHSFNMHSSTGAINNSLYSLGHQQQTNDESAMLIDFDFILVNNNNNNNSNSNNGSNNNINNNNNNDNNNNKNNNSNDASSSGSTNNSNCNRNNNKHNSNNSSNILNSASNVSTCPSGSGLTTISSSSIITNDVQRPQPLQTPSITAFATHQEHMHHHHHHHQQQHHNQHHQLTGQINHVQLENVGRNSNNSTVNHYTSYVVPSSTVSSTSTSTTENHLLGKAIVSNLNGNHINNLSVTNPQVVQVNVDICELGDILLNDEDLNEVQNSHNNNQIVSNRSSSNNSNINRIHNENNNNDNSSSIIINNSNNNNSSNNNSDNNKNNNNNNNNSNNNNNDNNKNENNSNNNDSNSSRLVSIATSSCKLERSVDQLDPHLNLNEIYAAASTLIENNFQMQSEQHPHSTNILTSTPLGQLHQPQQPQFVNMNTTGAQQQALSQSQQLHQNSSISVSTCSTTSSSSRKRRLAATNTNTNNNNNNMITIGADFDYHLPQPGTQNNSSALLSGSSAPIMNVSSSSSTSVSLLSPMNYTSKIQNNTSSCSSLIGAYNENVNYMRRTATGSSSEKKFKYSTNHLNSQSHSHSQIHPQQQQLHHLDTSASSSSTGTYISSPMNKIAKQQHHNSNNSQSNNMQLNNKQQSIAMQSIQLPLQSDFDNHQHQHQHQHHHHQHQHQQQHPHQHQQQQPSHSQSHYINLMPMNIASSTSTPLASKANESGYMQDYQHNYHQPTTGLSVLSLQSQQPQQQQQLALPKGKRYDEFKCWVCGEQSSGNHYGALTCEACKLFFKRHSATQQQQSTSGSFSSPSVSLSSSTSSSLSSSSSSSSSTASSSSSSSSSAQAEPVKTLTPCAQRNCQITLLTRSSCPECRFRKCIAVGMGLNRTTFGRHTSLQKFKYNTRVNDLFSEIMKCYVLLKNRLDSLCSINSSGNCIAGNNKLNNMTNYSQIMNSSSASTGGSNSTKHSRINTLQKKELESSLINFYSQVMDLLMPNQVSTVSSNSGSSGAHLFSEHLQHHYVQKLPANILIAFCLIFDYNLSMSSLQSSVGDAMQSGWPMLAEHENSELKQFVLNSGCSSTSTDAGARYNHMHKRYQLIKKQIQSIDECFHRFSIRIKVIYFLLIMFTSINLNSLDLMDANSSLTTQQSQFNSLKQQSNYTQTTVPSNTANANMNFLYMTPSKQPSYNQFGGCGSIGNLGAVGVASSSYLALESGESLIDNDEFISSIQRTFIDLLNSELDFQQNTASSQRVSLLLKLDQFI